MSDLTDSHRDPSTTPASLRCSAKMCHADASWQVIWNNPRIHPSDREKVWLACDDHHDSLADYLRVKSMLRRVDPLTADKPGVL